MANVDYAFGFELHAGPAEVIELEIDASNATTIGKGDPLTIEADGANKRSVAGDGVAVGYVAQSFKNSDGESISYLPASTAGTITGIKCVPGQIWRVQLDSGTAGAATMVGATCDFVAGNADTNTGRSIYEADSSNVGTGNQLKIVGLFKEQGNSWAEHAVVLCEFAENNAISSASI
tara:strand:+ start:95 stop:625 length:531 start_codon:yes stop_codon:yes gene_type:complete